MKNFKMLTAAVLALSFSLPSIAAYTVSTGGEGGFYEALGVKFATQVEKATQNKVDAGYVNSNGTLANIACMNDGSCQAAVVQMDGLNVSPITKVEFKTKAAHTEVVYWLYNLKHGKADLEDIEKSTEYVIVLVDDSGADVTLSNFAKTDKGYQVNYDHAVLAEDAYEAFYTLSEGYTEDGTKVAGMLYVGRDGSIPSEMIEDFGDKFGIGEATDGDFDDAEDVNGNDLYTTCEIKKSQGLKVSNTNLIGRSEAETVCVKAAIVYTTPEGVSKSKMLKAATKATRGLK